MKKYQLSKSSQRDTFYLQQMISNFLWLLILSVFVPHSFIQAQCDFFEGNISLNAENGNTDTNFSTEYYLTDENDVILQINNTADFAMLTSGNYMAYSINYETSEGISDNTIGNMISDINGSCFDVSDAYAFRVCGIACDYLVGENMVLNANGGNTNADFTNLYILSDANGYIINTNNTASFTANTEGTFYIYAVNYETTAGINGTNIGNHIDNITGNCFDITKGLILNICPAECTWFENTYSFDAIGGNNNGFTTQYVLTDDNGLIEDISDVAFFNNYNDGLHLIYPLNYENGNVPPNLNVGNSIADITATCIDIGLPLLFKYCPKDFGCDFYTGNEISLQILNDGNTSTDFTTSYLLTDEIGNILNINTTPTFTIDEMGNYNIFGINYETATGINGLENGQNIMNITGNCFDLGTPYCFTVCPAECTWFENTYSFDAIGGNNNGFTTQYVLTDESGLIEDISDVAFFNNYNDGLHLIYPLNYEDGNTPIDLSIGNSIADITASCIDIGLPLLFKYCPKDFGCDFYTGNEISLQILNDGNTSTDFTTSYLLTDEIGNILETNTTPTFTIDEMGNYNIFGINYETATGINGLENGENVMNIAGNCFDLGTPYCFTVCPAECTWYSDTYIFYSTPENESIDFTTVYVLTNENGQIMNTNSTPIFTDLAAGNYLIYPINYDSSENINGLTNGENMNAVYGNCLDIGYPLAFKYCPCGPDCDISPNNSFTFNSTGENTDADFTTEFLLVDMDGNIIDKSTTAQFGNVALGQYQIIAINYDNTSVPNGLNIGDNLIDIAGGCLDFSEPICLNVCDTCEPVHCFPIIITKINN